MMPGLFDPITLRGETIRNRIGVSPMCQYSATDGMPDDWHVVHLGARAVGGAGLVMVEATAVSPEGRITPGCTGIWSDAHIEPHARIARFVAGQGATPAIQLAHAGRKASRVPPWEGGHALRPEEGAWQVIGASAIPFDAASPVPAVMDEAMIAAVTDRFVAAAKRSVAAGYRLIELHAAHGYLFHSFCSPLSNRRNDAWGGDLAGRTRFLCDTARAVRAAIPASLPLAVRISHTDWKESGWTTADSVALATMLAETGVDLIDVSSGGNAFDQKIPMAPGYQVPGATAVRAAGLPVAAVGLITEPTHAEAIIRNGEADMVFLARVLLRDPYWPLRAAETLKARAAARLPIQYARAWEPGFGHDPAPPAMRRA
jgi:2,4-dienoyl-CoA reductase-like NADH-dependent reductase (Old Yellow Enzyme family)